MVFTNTHTHVAHAKPKVNAEIEIAENQMKTNYNAADLAEQPETSLKSQFY